MIWKILFLVSVFIIIYTYIGYPIILLIINSFISKKEKATIEKDKKFYPTVTLIIPAYNEENTIENKILNSLSLDYPVDKRQIIVGSDGSSDTTNQIVSKYSGDRVELDFDHQRIGKVKVVQRCIGKATGDIIVFSDANSKLQKDALKNLVRHFINGKIGCVCGNTIHVKTFDNNTIQIGEGFYYKFESFVKRLESNLGSVLGASDGFFAIRKESFAVLSETRGDDFEIPILIRLNGEKSIFDKNVLSEEDCSENLKSDFSRRTRIVSWNIISLFMLLKLAVVKHNIFLIFQLISHKLLRWFLPIFMIVQFVITIFVRSFVTDVFLVCNILFVIFAMLGYMFPFKKGILFKLPHIVTSFINMNASSLVGIIKGILNMQTELWDKVR